jgi:hypothetical protein
MTCATACLSELVHSDVLLLGAKGLHTCCEVMEYVEQFEVVVLVNLLKRFDVQLLNQKSSKANHKSCAKIGT